RHLQPERICHGLRAIAYTGLLQELAARGVALDVCPTSNSKTGAMLLGQPHPAQEYFRRGIPIAIGSDDPGIFGCTLLDEYAWLGEHGGFSFEQLCTLARGSFGCSFLSAPERARMARLPSLAPPQPRRD
ncbi:MAG: hypothetical protein ACRD1E_01300, partial [Terriglobales bacterium]